MKKKRTYTIITGPMMFDMRYLRSKGIKLTAIAVALGCSKTAVSSYTAGQYKNEMPEDYPIYPRINCVALTTDALKCVSDIHKHNSNSDEEIINEALWLMLEGLTTTQPTDQLKLDIKPGEAVEVSATQLQNHIMTVKELVDNASYNSNATPFVAKTPLTFPDPQPTRFSRLLAFLKSPAGI